MRITTTLLMAATLCTGLLTAGEASGSPKDDIPPRKVAEPAAAENAVDAAEQSRLIVEGFEAETRYRYRLAELRRLHDLSIDAADRVRAEQLAEMRTGVVRRHHARRDAVRAQLVDEWREQFDAALELSGADGPELRSMPARTSPRPEQARSSTEASGNRFARRRTVAKQRITDQRSASHDRQEAARTRVQGVINNGRAVSSYRASRPSATRAAASSTNPRTAESPRSSATEPARVAPEPIVRLVSHGEAYARASTKIVEANASQTFWRLKKELAREAKKTAAH